MSVQTARHTGIQIRGARATEIWNAGLAFLESAGFGLGLWLVLTVLTGIIEDPFFTITGGPEAPILAAALFLVGRLWVGRDGLAVAWSPRITEAIVLGLIIGLVGRGIGWGYSLMAAYVPLPDAMVLGFLRGAWRATALVVPYVFATDRPARSDAH